MIGELSDCNEYFICNTPTNVYKSEAFIVHCVSVAMEKVLVMHQNARYYYKCADF